MKLSKKQSSFLAKVLACLTIMLMMVGVMFSLPNVGEKNITADAATIEYQDLLGIENRDWGAASDEYYFGGVTLEPFGYFDTANSVSGCWYNGNQALIDANNGVDILQYIYVNGKSARDAITENNGALLGSSGWLTNPAASPVYVETTNGSGILIKILKAYAGDNFTITFKAGFSLIRNDGETIYVSDDIVYNCVGNVPTKVQKSTVTFQNEAGSTLTTKRVVTGQSIGELPSAPEKAGYVGVWKMDGKLISETTVINGNKTATPVYALEYEDFLGLENRTSWGAHTGEYYFGGVKLNPGADPEYFNTAASVSTTWYVGNTAPITANNGVDIMEYIYVNGESARSLITANTNGANLSNACGCWLSNPAAYPVYVETTNGSGIMIRLAKAAFGDNFTITFKAGFSLIRNDGETIYVSSDITHTYANGTLGGRTVDKQYTLNFDGAGEVRKLKNGATIGELPAVPAKDGCEGVWTIDGVEITANTVYNYGANKTAVAVYSKDITDTIGLGDWGVPASESDIRYLWIRNGLADIGTAYPNSYWNDHADNKNSNFGVDIMEYILIDGESVRSIINKNAAGETSYKASSTFPLNIGGCYAPISIETAGDGIRFKVMVDYKTSFKVTFKAGFTLISNGIKMYTSEDVTYKVGSTMGDISKSAGYTLTFEGGETKDLENGAVIGELPAIPAKEGYEAAWMIDGVEITANTVYNYGADKTAVAVYSKNITDTIALGDWGVPASEPDLRFLWIRNGLEEIGTAYPYDYWNDHADNKNSNFGVDIMEYILIDGESVRSIINKNAAGETSYKASSTFPLNMGGCYAPICIETAGDGIHFKVMVDYKTAFELTFKAGFTLVDANGYRLYTAEDVIFNVGDNNFSKVMECTLSFDGLMDTVTVINGSAIGELPQAPAKDGCEGVWTIDGVEISENTIYNYGADKTAVAAYRADISNYIALENRAWGAASDEYYFGVLDMRESNAVVNGETTTYYLNTANSVSDCWYNGNQALINANNGVDILQYIYVNGKSARDAITENNGALLGSNGWLTNPAASPVYVETTNGSGIMIKILKAFAGDFFELTLKSGFSILNSENVRVYLTKDVTYKYIKSTTNNPDDDTFRKGEITQAELDKLGGQKITLMNGDGIYEEKSTRAWTLPDLSEDRVEGNTLAKVLVGWTTNPDTLPDLYPVGYTLKPTAATTLYAVWIGFELQDGAQARLAAGSSGIRFLTDIDAVAYNQLTGKGVIKGTGTFLVPTDYLLKVGEDNFAHSGFANPNYYIDRATDVWKVQTGNTWTYAAAFVGIGESQYARQFSARGYLKVQFTTGEGYVYTPYNAEYNARSIYEVALAAYDDEENPQYQTHTTILNYLDKVAKIDFDENYLFEAAPDVYGHEKITTISKINTKGRVKVTMTEEVSSFVINGVRITFGTSANIKIGNFLLKIHSLEKVDGGYTFYVGGAENDYNKDSDETLLFDSSDDDLDAFLNDYFKRHSAYVDDGENMKVNTAIGGVNSQEFFSQEWLSNAYYWYNSFEGYVDEKGNNQDRIDGLREFLSTVPVDDYGYVWSSNDAVRAPDSEVATGEQKMGWPFPNNDTVKTAHWEFNSKDGGTKSSNINANQSGGLYGATVSNQSSNITFTLGAPSTKKIYTFYAPLLEFEVRMADATNVEDILVWYTTNSSTSFSTDKRVSVNEKAFIKYDYSGKYEHILYLPMYAESAWGESTSTYIKQLKIEIVLKSGKTMSGNVALNYVRPTLDTRMSNNNSILISSLRIDYDNTGDLTFLQENITRARKAMNFLMQMYDENRGLKKESYLVGHGGTKKSLNWLGNATSESIASSISQGYWDIMYMPEYDFQSNTYFYKAVRDMAYLEEVLTANNKTVDTSAATVKTATRNKTTGTCAYSYDLASVADTVLANLRKTTENTNHTGFWDAEDGRFVAGYASGEGKWYDYGYVAWNLEAIYYGIATEEQAAAIMSWLQSEDDLYKYVFAPQSITVTGDADALNGEYAARGDRWVNCQFGGAIMYTSFYDLMARINVLGADNAFERLKAIEAWYEEVKAYYEANGTNPEDFYRYYYENLGIQMQGTGTAGAVGIDDEFLESFLPVSAVAYGFFGLEANGNILQIDPELPDDLVYWEMENLAFNFVKYDLKIYDNGFQLTNVRVPAGKTLNGLKLKIVVEEGQTVYVNGFKKTTQKDEAKPYVLVDFGAVAVEVK